MEPPKTVAAEVPTAPLKVSPLSHPRGLWTLFLTEMWERFSYYGMRALLVLFMVDRVRGGMGMDDATATAIYGLYTAFVYLAALPGGWMADRLLGAQRAVFMGGAIIALGHFTMAVPTTRTFFLGLILVVVGTGLLKPNISAIVGQLYPEGGARRDAGFTIFYLGINVGATAGPIICGLLGEKVNWHYGFAAAGVGMVLGLIQFAFTHRWLGDAGRAPGHFEGTGPTTGFDRAWLGVGLAFVVLAAVVAAGMFGVLPLNPVKLAKATTYVIVGMAVLYFAFIFVFGKLDGTETKHVAMIVILFIAAAMFWAGFEQAGSSLNLFAERYTHRLIGWFTIEGKPFEIPASWFQSLNPAFIITLAPLFAMFWVWLARRQLNPSIPVKFASGLIQLALGFLIMVGAAKLVLRGVQNGQPAQVMPTWLIFTYLFHTMGEICLSPVGLSSVTKLSPRRFVGQMMGTWFMAASLGNLLAGLMAGRFRDDAVEQFPALYMQVVITSFGVGLLLLIFFRPLRRLTVGVK